MIPNALELENYRAFAARQRVELRPLTLVYGRNNAGKSALLRVFPLISDSLVSGEMSPLHFESEAIRGAGFHDIKCKGRNAQTIDFKFEWTQGPIESFEVGTAYEDNWNRAVPLDLYLQRRGEAPKHFRCELLDDEKLEQDLTFRLVTTEQESDEFVQINWQGMTPDSDGESYSPLFEELGESLKSITGGVQWLSSVREPPARLVSQTGALPKRLGKRGKGVVPMLHLDQEVSDAVSKWYETHLSRCLRVVEDNRMLRTVLMPVESAGFDVDLVDCGEGLIQVLPVLTALEMLRHPRTHAPMVLAVEEPESHLHPKLQRALASHLCEVANQSGERRIIFETHSQHILLGIRLAVLEGRIDRKDVAIHWVTQSDDGSSDIRLAELNKYAELSGEWPPSVYGDDTEMARQIWKLKRRQMGGGES